MSDDPARERHIAADRETVRGWADEHDAVPVRTTGGTGKTDLALVPEHEADEYERLDWETFYDELEGGEHVVTYREQGDPGDLEILGREEAMTQLDVEREEFEQSLLEGETVTGTITETTVVETTVVEEADIESQLVDSEIIDERVAGVELLDRECTACDLVETSDAPVTDWFDSDHYVQSRPHTRTTGETTTTTGTETTTETETTDETGERTLSMPDVDVETVPYHAELDVEERYLVTRELVEQLTVETRIVDVDVTEMDSVEDQDFDVEGLQRSILRSDLFDIEGEPDELLTEHYVESEFGEGDEIHTYFNRRLTVEDEVRDRKRLRTDVAGIDDHEMEIVESRDVESAFTSEEGLAAGTMEGTMAGTETTTETGEMAGEHRVTFESSDQGKDVVNAAGDEVGMITEVDETEGVAYVDPHPSMTERIMAKLDWGDVEDEDYPLGEDQVSRITDDYVELREGPEVEEGETT